MSARVAGAAAVMALLLLPATASAGPVEDLLAPPASGRCLAGVQLVHCADATAAVGVSCSVNATHYSCTVSLSYSARGWTQGGLPGQVTTSGMYEVSVCDGTDCTRDFFGADAPCSWALGAGGCSGNGSATRTVAGPWSGCFEVYSDIDLTAYTHFPGVQSGVVQDIASAWDSVTNC